MALHSRLHPPAFLPIITDTSEYPLDGPFSHPRRLTCANLFAGGWVLRRARRPGHGPGAGGRGHHRQASRPPAVGQGQVPPRRSRPSSRGNRQRHGMDFDFTMDAYSQPPGKSKAVIDITSAASQLQIIQIFNDGKGWSAPTGRSWELDKETSRNTRRWSTSKPSLNLFTLRRTMRASCRPWGTRRWATRPWRRAGHQWKASAT